MSCLNPFPSIMECYLRFRQQCKEWQQVHENLLRILSLFQSKVESSRVVRSTEEAGSLNQSLDPFYIENLYERIQDEPKKLEKILNAMYSIYNEAKQMVPSEGYDTPCNRRDYINFIGVELDMYEAEYQHIVSLRIGCRADTHG